MQVRWGIEMEGKIFSGYMENVSGEHCRLDLHDAVSIETFVRGKSQPAACLPPDADSAWRHCLCMRASTMLRSDGHIPASASDVSFVFSTI